MFFDQYDAIYCINLKERPDRWAAAQAEFKKAGILDRVTRFEACIGEGRTLVKKAEDGCRRSHCSIVREAIVKKFRNVFIFEDDIIFSGPVPDVKLPANYGMMYLGVHYIVDYKVLSDDLLLITDNGYCTHAYGMSAAVYRAFLHAERSNQAIDKYLTTTLHKLVNCYCVNPPVVWQTGLQSNISGNMPMLKDSLERYNMRAQRLGGAPVSLVL